MNHILTQFHAGELCNFALGNTTKQPRPLYLKTLKSCHRVHTYGITFKIKLRLEYNQQVPTV